MGRKVRRVTDSKLRLQGLPEYKTDDDSQQYRGDSVRLPPSGSRGEVVWILRLGRRYIGTRLLTILERHCA